MPTAVAVFARFDSTVIRNFVLPKFRKVKQAGWRPNLLSARGIAPGIVCVCEYPPYRGSRNTRRVFLLLFQCERIDICLLPWAECFCRASKQNPCPISCRKCCRLSRMDCSKSLSVTKARSFNPKNSKVTGVLITSLGCNRVACCNSALDECRISSVDLADSVCRITFWFVWKWSYLNVNTGFWTSWSITGW